MQVRYIEFFDLGGKSAVTYLNAFIKSHPSTEVEPLQFAFDYEGHSSILARVTGSDVNCRSLDLEYEKEDFEGMIM